MTDQHIGLKIISALCQPSGGVCCVMKKEGNWEQPTFIIVNDYVKEHMGIGVWLLKTTAKLTFLTCQCECHCRR